MRSVLMIIVPLVLLFAGNADAQGTEGLKVFISVDMEGITGVVNEDDASRAARITTTSGRP